MTRYSNYLTVLRERFKNKDKFYSISDSAVVSLGRFATGIALAKLAGAEAFAQYLLLLTAGFFILSIPTTLCITPMINLSSGLEADKKFGIFKWTHQNLKKFMRGGIILSLAAYPLIRYFEVDPLIYFGFVSSLFAWLELNYRRACLQTLFKMKGAAIFDLIGLILTAACVAWAFYFYNAPVAGFWWGSALASLFAAVGMAIIVKRAKQTLSLVELPHHGIRKEAFSTGSAMLTGSIANSFCARLAPFVLGSLGGLMTVANFGASWTLVGPLRMVSGALSGLLRPRLAMHQNTGNRKRFDHAMKQAFLLVGAVGGTGILISALLGPSIVALFFDESLRSAGWILPLAMTYATIEVVTSIQVIALQTTFKDGAVIATKLRILAAAVSLSLIYPACLWFGAWGAYAAIFLAEMSYFVLALIALGKRPMPHILRPVVFSSSPATELS